MLRDRSGCLLCAASTSGPAAPGARVFWCARGVRREHFAARRAVAAARRLQSNIRHLVRETYRNTLFSQNLPMDATTAHKTLTMSVSDRQALLRFASRALSRNNHHKLARFLRRWGLNPFVETSTDNTLLHAAVLRDSIQCARVLLKGGYSPINGVSTMVRSVPMAALLLDHGADVNAPNTQGHTALHLAVQTDVALSAYLISRGANVHACHPPLYETPLHLAACVGHAAAVRLLLQAGADPNALASRQGKLDKRGRTPLDAAFDFYPVAPRLAVSRALLAAGARWHCRNPIEHALRHAWHDISATEHELIELLVAHGASPDLDPTQYRVYTCLLRYGANPNALNARGNSPLHTALHRVEASYSLEAAALILAGGRLTEEEMWSSEHCKRQLARRFGITEATADWPACIRARLRADELRSLRPLVKLP